MKNRLLPAFATCLLTASTSFAVADDGDPEGETPLQKEDREASAQGKFAAGVRVQVASGGADTFNFIGVDLKGRYNVTDIIQVQAKIPFAVSKPDGFGVFGGMMAGGSVKLGGMIGAQANVGFMKYGAALLTEMDAPAYVDAADYEAAFVLGPWLKLKAGPTYLSFKPAFVYQGGPESITGIIFPAQAMLRPAAALKVHGDLVLATGDDFKLGASDGGRFGIGAGADIKVSTIELQLAAGFASLLTDDAGLYTSVGKSVYVTVGLMYAK